jgi:hypothetical protein
VFIKQRIEEAARLLGVTPEWVEGFIQGMKEASSVVGLGSTDFTRGWAAGQGECHAKTD